MIDRNLQLSPQFNGKRVMVTGHTGFKGAWLTTWLLKLGAEVYGISDGIPTDPAMIETLNLPQHIKHSYIDICEKEKICAAITDFRPEYIFHLAAQSIVKTSYEAPVETFATNVMGTANVLDALRGSSFPCNIIVVTSDKCYRNTESLWGYKETDNLGGDDPYSASKAATELVVHSYYKSFFSAPGCPVRIASVRAGNVIGGGDWAADRIVPDCIRSWKRSQPVMVRNPHAIRPWQHVLDPLYGYLKLAGLLATDANMSGNAFNFGPEARSFYAVSDLINELWSNWKTTRAETPFVTGPEKPSFKETSFLKVNSEKAAYMINWAPALPFAEAVEYTASWYEAYLADQDMLKFTEQQIRDYSMLQNQLFSPADSLANA
jgi:CDP-glucose 4,6-dehydratase